MSRSGVGQWFLNIVTLLLALFTALMAWYTMRAADAAYEGGRMARAQMIESQRPKLAIVDVEFTKQRFTRHYQPPESARSEFKISEIRCEFLNEGYDTAFVLGARFFMTADTVWLPDSLFKLQVTRQEGRGTAIPPKCVRTLSWAGESLSLTCSNDKAVFHACLTTCAQLSGYIFEIEQMYSLSTSSWQYETFLRYKSRKGLWVDRRVRWTGP